jgi:hypothetical protein
MDATQHFQFAKQWADYLTVSTPTASEIQLYSQQWGIDVPATLTRIKLAEVAFAERLSPVRKKSPGIDMFQE